MTLLLENLAIRRLRLIPFDAHPYLAQNPKTQHLLDDNVANSGHLLFANQQSLKCLVASGATQSTFAKDHPPKEEPYFLKSKPF